MAEQFGEIYDQYVGKIYRFIFLKVDSRETAEDLCSEVFVRALREFQRGSIENMQAFLYQLARYAIADHYRQKASIKVVPLEEGDVFSQEEGSSLFDQMILGSELDQVRRTLFQLRDEYQNLIILRYVDELSIPEIAQITGKTEGNVRVGIHRALGALREELKDRENVLSAKV